MSLALLQHLALVAASLALVVAALLSVSYRWIGPALGRLGPVRRFRALLAVGLSPLLLGAGGALLTVLPSVAGLLWPGLDHCPDHHAGHDHLCPFHGPAPLGLPGWLVLAALGALLLPAVLRELAALARAARAARRLVARGSSGPGPCVVESEAPFALTVGLLAPRIVVSRGLLSVLDPDHLEPVLAHERAHLRRRDSLWKVLVSLAAAPLLPPARRALLRDLVLAAEQACDRQAALELGDGLKVAQAILATERLLGRFAARPEVLTTAFDAAPAVSRVEALLEPAERPAAPAAAALALVLLVTLAGLLASPLHHFAESLLGHLGR